MTIQELYKKWCKETKRSGGILVGGSVQEFFVWLDENRYYIKKHVEYSPEFMASLNSIEESLNRK